MANAVFYETVQFGNSSFPMKIDHSRLPALSDERTGISNPFIHWHEHIELHWFEKGGARVLAGNEWIVAEDGDIIVVNPSELHTLLPGAAETSYYFLIISPLLLGGNPLDTHGDFWEALTTHRLQFTHLVRNDPLLSAILSDIVSEYTSQAPGYELVVRGQLLRLMAQLYRAHRQVQPLTLTKKWQDERLKETLLYIAQHYSEPLTPQILATRCSLHPSYFCRLFRQNTGMTATAYICAYRISKATELLASTDLSVADVAFRVGFLDTNYFSRCFKRQCGLAPLPFRQREKARQ